jgi:hypothetical protein
MPEFSTYVMLWIEKSRKFSHNKILQLLTNQKLFNTAHITETFVLTCLMKFLKIVEGKS